MTLIDANLVLYAYNASAPQHSVARVWMEEILSKPEPIRFAWVTILAFLRITTNARVFPHPLTTDAAAAAVSSWFAQPAVTVLDPGERHWEILRGLLSDAQANGPLVMDAHLAALAIEHGATLLTTDQDFSRFPNLMWNNPLRPPK